MSSGTRSLTTTYGNWRWCSVEQLPWSSKIIDLTAASHLCCNSSSGPPFQECRAQAKVYMMYRIVYSLVDIPSSHLTPTLSVRGHNMKSLIPYARTFTYQRSFFPDTIRMWNSLPQTVVSCSTQDSFREEVQLVDLY